MKCADVTAMKRAQPAVPGGKGRREDDNDVDDGRSE
jgi:hypothetical protein